MLNIVTGLATDITATKCTCCLGMLKNYSFSRQLIETFKIYSCLLISRYKNQITNITY